MQTLFEALRSDKSRDVWSEIRKINGRTSLMYNCIDGNYGNDDSVHVFSDTYYYVLV